MEKKTLAQLEKELGIIRGEINERKEKEIRDKHYPRLEKEVGNCFAYRDNTYGGDSGKWDVFKKVLEVFYNKDGTLMFVTEEFSTDCNGKSRLEVDTHFPYPEHEEPFNSGYVRIESDEYDQAKTVMLLEMASRKILKKKA